jgi:DNA-3-methyladenine glycosylase
MTISLSNHYRILLPIPNLTILVRKYTKLPASFYRGDDVVAIAKQLVGKLLVSVIDGKHVSGRIIETEAYAGLTDRASHAFSGRRTARTEVLYMDGGVAYVYLCYGIHHLFNVVTHHRDVPHAVLVRAIAPLEGREHMMERFGLDTWREGLGTGPGNVSKAMGIRTSDTGISLQGDRIFIADDGERPPALGITPRIGVDYAGEDAALPYRFVEKGHPLISARSFTTKFLS